MLPRFESEADDRDLEGHMVIDVVRREIARYVGDHDVCV
jgi:hypothetical protein